MAHFLPYSEFEPLNVRRPANLDRARKRFTCVTEYPDSVIERERLPIAAVMASSNYVGQRKGTLSLPVAAARSVRLSFLNSGS